MYWPFAAGRAIGAGEALRIFIPDAHLLIAHFTSLTWPHWNPWAGLGQPLGGSLQAQAYYPVRWVSLLTFDAVASVSVMHVLHVWIAAGGAWFAARRLRLSFVAAAIVSVSYAASPLFTHLASWPDVTASAAWTPWVMYAAHGLSRRKTMRRRAVLAGVFAMSVLGASLEITAGQLFLAAAILGRRGLWPVAHGASSAAWALALAAITVLPFIELVGESGRGAPSVESASVAQVLQMFWLEADGVDQRLLAAPFVGSSVLVLIVFAVARRFRRVRWLLVPALVLIVCAFGMHVPVVRNVLVAFQIREPWKHLVTAAFSLCLVAGYGVSPLVHWLRQYSWRRPLAIFAAVVGLGAVVVAVQRSVGVPGLVSGALFCAFLFGAGVSRGVAAVVVATELLCAHALIGMPEWIAAGELRRPSALIDKAKLLPGERVAVNPARAPLTDNTQSRQLLLPNRFVEEGVAAVTAYGDPLPGRTGQVMEGADLVLLELLSVRFAVGYWNTPERALWLCTGLKVTDEATANVPPEDREIIQQAGIEEATAASRIPGAAAGLLFAGGGVLVGVGLLRKRAEEKRARSTSSAAA